MNNYAGINMEDQIETPPEDYDPNRIGEEVSVDQLQQQRNKDIPGPVMRQ